MVFRDERETFPALNHLVGSMLHVIGGFHVIDALGNMILAQSAMSSIPLPMRNQGPDGQGLYP